MTRVLDRAEQASLTAGASMWSTVSIPDADVPAMTLADGPMGVASGRVDERDVSLLTPCAMALGASWNPALVARVGAVVGSDAVRRGVDCLLAPNLNLARSPLAGRAFEYFSEDPLLAAVLGAAWIGGLQSTGTGSVAKHLVCNDSETERHALNAVVDQRTLREVYLLPFEHAARAGCVGMLTAYNKVNGSWCAEHGQVIAIVKDEWAFPGFLVSDWFGTHSTAGSVAARLDLEMPGPARFLGDKAVDADKRWLAEASERVARGARAVTGPKTQMPEDEQHAVLVEAAAAGFVLLKNDGVLPLDLDKVRTVAVIGPNADAPCYQGGTFAKIAVDPAALRPLEAIREGWAGRVEVVHEPGLLAQARLPAMRARPARDLGDGCTAGMTVDYLAGHDDDAVPVASETRDANSLVWFGGVHDETARLDRAGTVRASGRYVADHDGTHVFHLGATGAATLRIDGVERLRADEVVAPGDTMGKLKRGDSATVSVDMNAGDDVLVEVEFRYQPARVHGLWYGVRAPSNPATLLARAVAAAAAADAVVLIVGETSDASVESKDRDTTLLLDDQVALIRAVGRANPRTVVVGNVGHAFDTAWDADVGALLVAWYPGEEFGRALARTLSGELEPAGRLPVSFAASDADYPAYALAPDADGRLPYADGTRIGYRGIAAAGKMPRHAFGAGLGYGDPVIDAVEVVRSGDGATVSARVRNRAARRGSVVVQVYREEPELTLVGFATLTLDAGQEAVATVDVPARAFQCWDDGWVPVGRAATLRTGLSCVDLPFSHVVDLAG